MTSGEESNLADVPDQRLFVRLRRLVKRRAEMRIEIGAIIAELVSRDYSFRTIGQRGGFPWQNGYRWYLKAIEILGKKPKGQPTEDDPADSDA